MYFRRYTIQLEQTDTWPYLVEGAWTAKKPKIGVYSERGLQCMPRIKELIRLKYYIIGRFLQASQYRLCLNRVRRVEWRLVSPLLHLFRLLASCCWLVLEGLTWTAAL